MSESNLQPRTARHSESLLAERMMPHNLNHLNNVFGGDILALVDQVGGVTCSRHSAMPCVTVAVERVEFREPVYAGELLTVTGRLTYVGRTSMEVLVEVHAEDIIRGIKRHTNSCLLTFVAIDEAGKPQPVPPLLLETEEDFRLYQEGKQRRAERLEREGRA